MLKRKKLREHTVEFSDWIFGGRFKCMKDKNQAPTDSSNVWSGLVVGKVCKGKKLLEGWTCKDMRARLGSKLLGNCQLAADRERQT